MQADDLGSFEIYPSGGGAEVIVNGKDISEQVVSYQLTHNDKELPRLVLVTNVVAGVIQGKGIVEVQISEDSTLLNRLAALNPGLVEEKALEGLEWGDGGNMTAAIIKTILEMLSGDQPDRSASGGGETPPG